MVNVKYRMFLLPGVFFKYATFISRRNASANIQGLEKGETVFFAAKQQKIY
jgi:hypothetical protein